MVNFILTFLIFLFASCSHIQQTPDAEKITFLNSEETAKIGCVEVARVTGIAKLFLFKPDFADARNSLLNSAARYDANAVVKTYERIDGFLKRSRVLYGTAYTCSEPALKCLSSEDGKACYEHALDLIKKKDKSNHLALFIIACKANYKESCTRLNLILEQFINQCSIGKLDSCYSATNLSEQYPVSTLLEKRITQAGCNAGDSYYCDKIAESDLLTGCQSGKGNKCFSLGQLWAKHDMKNQSIAAYEKGCQLGEKAACIPFSAITTADQLEIRNSLLYQQVQAIIMQTQEIKRQTAQAAFDSALNRQIYIQRTSEFQSNGNQSTTCKTVPQYSFDGRVTSYKSDCH